MTAFTNRRLEIFACLCAATGLMSAPGCKKPDPGFEIMTLEGKVEAIERNADGTGRITVRYYSDRHEAEITGTGVVNQQTEIMINGVASELEDIVEGDRVRGDVRVETKGDRREQIALKIHVNRPEPVGGD